MSLETQIGETFVKERHGVRVVVVLEEVRKNKVLLRVPERKDCFRETLADFTKHYQKQ